MLGSRVWPPKHGGVCAPTKSQDNSQNLRDREIMNTSVTAGKGPGMSRTVDVTIWDAGQEEACYQPSIKRRL